MGISLARLPPSGAIIGEVDYEKHKPEYYAIFKNLETGVDLIEDGILFEHVRVCRMHVRLRRQLEVGLRPTPTFEGLRLGRVEERLASACEATLRKQHKQHGQSSTGSTLFTWIEVCAP